MKDDQDALLQLFADLQCTKHHWIKTTLGDNTVLLTVLLVQPLLDRHTYVGNGNTNLDTDQQLTHHS